MSFLQTIQTFLTTATPPALFMKKTDRFQNEYIPLHEDKIQHICGFDGSLGYVIITPTQAALFVDGRYITQAKQQVDLSYWDVYLISDMNPKAFCKQQGISALLTDFWLITKAQADQWHHHDITLHPLDGYAFDSLIDLPQQTSFQPIWPYHISYAGKNFEEKYAPIQSLLGENESFLLCDSPSINWLLNIRGDDIPFNPLCNGYAVLSHHEKIKFFTDNPHFQHENCESHTTAHLIPYLSNTKTLYYYDPSQTPLALEKVIQNKKIKNNPCILPKALKNSTEQNMARLTHIKDAVALCEFFSWLDKTIKIRPVGELEIVDVLLTYRKAQSDFLDNSFATIAGIDANGAIIHYRPTEKTQKFSQNNSLLLLDSGGHYLGGTTDITRTLTLGLPTQEQKECFTRVLRGHIALSQCTFPLHTTGSQLDVLARQFLWQAQLDYHHGTGHGVGNCLMVHEGPQSISKSSSSESLLAGMIVSNEPGYYKEGAFGIRLENLVLVVEKQHGWMGFETLTLVPFQPQMILWAHLNTNEITWLKNYYDEIREKIKPRLSISAQSWLKTQDPNLHLPPTIPQQN